MKIAIVGSGYVGLVTGSCFAHMGNTVQCIDVDDSKIQNLKQGILPIYEPGLDDIVKSNYLAGRLSFSTDLATAVKTSEFIFIAVGTPMSEDGSADLQHVLAVADQIGQVLENDQIVITKSTVPVGTARKVHATINAALKKRGVDVKFEVVSNPEFLKEGHAVNDFLEPDRIVIGTESEHVKGRLRAMYIPFCRTDEYRIHMMDIESAELTKYAANAMLANRISFMNEIAAVCEATGANIDDVRVGIGSDDRIGRRFLFPGIGYGGSCFPKDVRALIKTAEEHSIDLDLIKAIDTVNTAQKSVMASKIKRFYGNENLSGKLFAVWGLSFKPDTDDVRESPAAVVIAELLEAGAQIRAYDPFAGESFNSVYNLDIELFSDMYDCLVGADAVILATEWHHFRRPDFNRIKSALAKPVMFDGRNQHDPNYCKVRGFSYISIGRQDIL